MPPGGFAPAACGGAPAATRSLTVGEKRSLGRIPLVSRPCRAKFLERPPSLGGRVLEPFVQRIDLDGQTFRLGDQLLGRCPIAAAHRLPGLAEQLLHLLAVARCRGIRLRESRLGNRQGDWNRRTSCQPLACGEDEPCRQAANNAARGRFQVASPYYDKRTKPRSLAGAIVRVLVSGGCPTGIRPARHVRTHVMIRQHKGGGRALATGHRTWVVIPFAGHLGYRREAVNYSRRKSGSRAIARLREKNRQGTCRSPCLGGIQRRCQLLAIGFVRHCRCCSADRQACTPTALGRRFHSCYDPPTT